MQTKILQLKSQFTEKSGMPARDQKILLLVSFPMLTREKKKKKAAVICFIKLTPQSLIVFSLKTSSKTILEEGHFQVHCKRVGKPSRKKCCCHLVQQAKYIQFLLKEKPVSEL